MGIAGVCLVFEFEIDLARRFEVFARRDVLDFRDCLAFFGDATVESVAPVHEQSTGSSCALQEWELFRELEQSWRDWDPILVERGACL